jgi:septal ring factor EnvC (AmiA/AmiB activator)
MRRPPQPRRRPDPLLLGEPSPALGKIMKMNREQLQGRIANIRTEMSSLTAKIAALKQQEPKPQEKIDGLALQLARLMSVQKAAADRLAEKTERADQREGPRRPR